MKEHVVEGLKKKMAERAEPTQKKLIIMIYHRFGF